MTKFIVAVVALGLLVVIAFVWVTWGRKTLPPHLVDRTEFSYDTPLLVQKSDAVVGRKLMLRRVRDSQWEAAHPGTNFEVQSYTEPSMAVSYVRGDAFLLAASDAAPRIAVGRDPDRGSGMFGWHITMVKQGANPIDFSRSQRFQVWIEESYPTAISADGVPTFTNGRRWFFSGLADIVAADHYEGSTPPAEGDF